MHAAPVQAFNQRSQQAFLAKPARHKSCMRQPHRSAGQIHDLHIAHDRPALEDLLLRVSEIACELPEVEELDINPIVADENGVLALVHGQAAVVNAAACVGHALCVSECPAGAVTLGRVDAGVREDLAKVKKSGDDFDMAAVERVILTASGGALRDWPQERLAQATMAEALEHPNWSMGARITLDSASMFNKAMEVIETREFFAVDPEQIEVIIHPQSIVHALVAFRDGGVMAHMGAPDMRHPIGFALNWPDRAALPVARLDLARLGQLTFRAPDENRYPALRLARAVMAERGLAGAAFNAAKEVALDHFIAGSIGFMEMAGVVEDTLTKLSAEMRLGIVNLTLEDVQQMDHLARRKAAELARHRAKGR